MRSWLRPVAVHADGGTKPEIVEATLLALEEAYDAMARRGWPGPVPDGGLGGGGELDLYLVSGGAHFDEARADGAVEWTLFDTASAYAVVDPEVDRDALRACVVAAYAQAVLLSLDPAEALSWRRATATWLAWSITGRYGCDDAVERQQREPWSGWLSEGALGGSGGALFLAILSARHDGGSGEFIRDVWLLARQRSDSKVALRGSPDIWMALARALDVARDDLDHNVEEIAVSRWFAGDPLREPNSPMPILNDLNTDAAISATSMVALRRGSARSTPSDPALEPFGSGYVLFDVSAVARPGIVKLWLRGEFGVRWSFVAVRLGARGQELGRMRAPPRLEPSAYLPVEVTTDTEQILCVATNLSSRLPDADLGDDNIRSFQVIAEVD